MIYFSLGSLLNVDEMNNGIYCDLIANIQKPGDLLKSTGIYVKEILINGKHEVIF